MQELVIKEHDFTTPAQLHAYMKEQLHFPDYYGANLDALNDCLTDISAPLRIIIERDNSVQDAWFDKFCAVIGRAALENDALDLVCK